MGKNSIAFVLSAIASLPVSGLPSAQAADRVFGIETSLQEKSCALIDASELHPNPEIDYFDSECPGFGGYRVLFQGGDLRSWVNLKYGQTEVNLAGVLSASEGTFPEVASEALEWRVVVKGDQTLVPYAAILKIQGSDPSGGEKTFQHFSVIKLAKDKSCVFGAVQVAGNAPAALAKARQMADISARSKPCPKN